VKIKIELNGKEWSADLAKPKDISIPLHPAGPRAWYVDPLSIEPVLNPRFTGSVALGGNVNFRDIRFNPHGHGTHTESLGHIQPEITSVNQILGRYFFEAMLLSIEPVRYDGPAAEFRKRGDLIITAERLDRALGDHRTEALILRTLPNDRSKLTREWSGTNPPYVEKEALTLIRERGVKHFLIDLPSVDREEDGGKLEAHHLFWEGGRSDDSLCTITELIYVKNEIPDGYYLLEIQMAPFENDASPSRPVLYTLNPQ
jgi:kynurenine formamidase